MTLTQTEWNLFFNNCKPKDISKELPRSFLMFGQVMHGRILWGGEKWDVMGWAPPNGAEPFVELKEVADATT